MPIKDYITKALLGKAGKKMAVILYTDVIRPIAEKIVNDSDTPYDNMALAFLDDLVEKLIKKEDEAPKV